MTMCSTHLIDQKKKKTEIIEEKLSTYKFMISTTVIALS
jgi:hypothetical protein